MIKVTYSRKGKVVSDLEVENWALSVLKKYEKNKDKDIKIKIGSSLMISQLRVLINTKKINHKDIIFFNDDDKREVIVDKFGTLEYKYDINVYPNFYDVLDDLLVKLVDWSD